MRHVQPVVAVVLSRVSFLQPAHGRNGFLLLLPCFCNCNAQRLPSPPPPMRATLSHPGHSLVQQQLVADGSAEQLPTGINRRCATLHAQPIYPSIWRICVDRKNKRFVANTQPQKAAQSRVSVTSEQNYFRSPLFALVLVLSALCLALRPAVASRALSEKGNFQ